MKIVMKSAGVALGAVALLVIVSAVIIPYSGAYNIAASEDHTAFVRWMFSTTMHHSVERRAENITPPSEITDAMATGGAKQYKSMCQHCHGGPGVTRDVWARGMLPQPPLLSEAASEYSAAELFWLVKHGIKMSGMPAFGEEHGDETLWNIVAFVQKLPAMTDAQYAAHESGHNHSH